MGTHACIRVGIHHTHGRYKPQNKIRKDIFLVFEVSACLLEKGTHLGCPSSYHFLSSTQPCGELAAVCHLYWLFSTRVGLPFCLQCQRSHARRCFDCHGWEGCYCPLAMLKSILQGTASFTLTAKDCQFPNGSSTEVDCLEQAPQTSTYLYAVACETVLSQRAGLNIVTMITPLFKVSFLTFVLSTWGCLQS